MTFFNTLITIIAFLIPSNALAISLHSQDLNKEIRTKKIARIIGPIMPLTAAKFKKDMEATKDLSGDRVIFINSPGGTVADGEKMYKLMKAEQDKGVRMICFVYGEADSMAFNILTKCDERLSTPEATMLVHKVRIGMMDNMTAKQLRKLADDTDVTDEPYRQANAKAMGLTLEEYDAFADKETIWRAATLKTRGYLQGFADIDDSGY